MLPVRYGCQSSGPISLVLILQNPAHIFSAMSGSMNTVLLVAEYWKICPNNSHPYPEVCLYFIIWRNLFLLPLFFHCCLSFLSMVMIGLIPASRPILAAVLGIRPPFCRYSSVSVLQKDVASRHALISFCNLLALFPHHAFCCTVYLTAGFQVWLTYVYNIRHHALLYLSRLWHSAPYLRAHRKPGIATTSSPFSFASSKQSANFAGDGCDVLGNSFSFVSFTKNSSFVRSTHQ